MILILFYERDGGLGDVWEGHVHGQLDGGLYGAVDVQVFHHQVKPHAHSAERNNQ